MRVANTIRRHSTVKHRIKMENYGQNSGKRTKFKLNVWMDAIDGFHLSDVEFEVEVYTENSQKIIRFPKSDAIKIDDDNYKVMVDSSVCGAGRYWMTLIAYIPDTDFEDGIRIEAKTTFTGVTIDAR